MFFSQFLSQKVLIARSKMSRARQTPSSTAQPQPPLPRSEPEGMDIVAQAMASLSPGQESSNREFPQGTSFNQGANSFPSPGIGMPQFQGANSFPQGNGAEFDDGFRPLPLRTADYACDFYDPDMVHKKGVILQYINSNSTGASTAIGVTRINTVDPRKVPQYLSRNVTFIRQHAVSVLQSHLRLTLCAAGVLERLSPEDFSISFSWASLTDFGRSLSQPGRTDLAMGYAHCDGVLMPIQMCKSDQFPTYVVNVFIYLQDATRRSNAVIAKAREDAAARNNPDRQKYVKKHPDNSYKTMVNVASMAASQASAQTAETMKRAAPTLYEHFPPMPQGVAPEWNVTGRTSLPD
jgi:hypothetical protein